MKKQQTKKVFLGESYTMALLMVLMNVGCGVKILFDTGSPVAQLCVWKLTAIAAERALEYFCAAFPPSTMETFAISRSSVSPTRSSPHK